MMKTVTFLAIAGLATAASAQWYNGDPDLVNGLAAEFNTTVVDAFIFEDFDHAGGNITDIWGNFFWSSNITGFEWEIRSGMSANNGGTLEASGSSNSGFTMIDNPGTDWDAFGFVSYQLSVDTTGLNLGAGTYFLALSPVGDGTGRGFVQTTSHANGYGSPLDGGGFFYSNQFGANYEPIVNTFGVDYAASYGVNIPAPASVALLGLGGLVATRRRR